MNLFNGLTMMTATGSGKIRFQLMVFLTKIQLADYIMVRPWLALKVGVGGGGGGGGGGGFEP